jgi:hypothetical protein
MKFFSILSLASLITVIANAQFSGKLDSVVFFKSINFGQAILKEFFKDCPGVEDYENKYRLTFDSLDNKCKNKYADLFNFYGTSFSSAEIIANDKGQVYLVRLSRHLSPSDSIDAANIKYPPPIAAFYDSLVLRLGKPSQVMNESDPGYANYNGLRQTIIWEGYHTSFWLYVDVGPNEGWHDMRVDITARSFMDMPEQEEMLE